MLICDGKREQTGADGIGPLENGLLSIFSIWGRGERVKEGKRFLNYKFKNMVFIVNNSLKWDLKIIIIKLLVEI